MGNIFFDIGLSLDGFMAGENRGPQNPLGDLGVEIHSWMFKQDFFLRRLKFPTRGETGRDNEIIREVFDRAGSYIMGKRMFEEGEVNWPEDSPFEAPVFVLTHTPRKPWVRKGGTIFYFVTDGIESALEQASKAAGDKDIRISGGADTVRQFLEAGLVDDFSIHIAPILIGRGLRLFDRLEPSQFKFEPAGVIHSVDVSHLKYRNNKKAG